MWTARLGGLLAGFVRRVESVLQRDEIFAGLKRIEDGLFGLELLLRVVGGFDGQTDPAFTFIDLDHARGDFLVYLEHVLDLVDAVFADLGDMDQTIDIMLQSNKGTEAGELG